MSVQRPTNQAGTTAGSTLATPTPRSLPPWRMLRNDAALAAAVWVVTAALPVAVLGLDGYSPDAPPSVLIFGTLICAPLVIRRVAPLVSALLVAAASVFQLWALPQVYPFDLAVLIPIYSVAAYARQRSHQVTVLGVGFACSAYAAAQLFQYASEPAMGFALIGMLVAVSWVLGNLMARRRQVIERLQAQNLALARDHAQRTRLVAQTERAAIAREMHDVIAHSLSVVVVQAEGGAYAARQVLDSGTTLAPPDPAVVQAVETLETIATTARSALAETRRLVGVLRDTDGGTAYRPQEGLQHLDALVARLTDAGVPVQLEITGHTEDLPREVDFAAYRVIQEALTNILKHAGPGVRAWAVVQRSAQGLHVQVADDGAGPVPSDGEGHGLLGMRERVTALGGHLHAGPRPGGGFQVTAWIPTTTEDSDGATLYGPGGRPLDRRASRR